MFAYKILRPSKQALFYSQAAQKEAEDKAQSEIESKEENSVNNMSEMPPTVQDPWAEVNDGRQNANKYSYPLARTAQTCVCHPFRAKRWVTRYAIIFIV
uniref:Uncharacterized protein n=1 Tax=Parascaris equorum TaxID=6256 RepID=A0A914S1B9_PAREQ